MSYRWKVSVVVTSLLVLLFLQGSQAAVQTADLYEALFFCQTAEPKWEDNEELDDEELLRVMPGDKELEWRLPEFQKQKAEGAVASAHQELAVCINNLGISRKRANNTLEKNVPPEVKVYPELPVVLGKTNTLICFMDNFYPPVVNVSWYKNGGSVSVGVSNTDFYSKLNLRFRMFSYLSVTPESGDIYSCKVEHWGSQDPINKFWEPEESPSTSEVTGTVVCAFGLALGLVGVAVGTVLLIKGMKRNQSTRR
ncbi:H-2 class II histocompatibility antigen, A-U alpha chain-like isoform X2 [Latimeria chalumnae]|uniref:H-2 class II histocompatibility antigen, A-U alpha chain-like isoform X1 n=1 Tax=Latimeria chalumnae TaxID=7897 RepID=UPI00313CDFA2